MTPDQAMKITEQKIIEARRRQRDTTSPGERAMCERFVNRLLERWRSQKDAAELKEAERVWAS